MMCKRLTKLLAVSLVLGLMLGRANADLVGYWNFDEGEGQVVRDKSGNNKDGRLGSSTGGDSNDPTWCEGKR